MRFFLRTRKFKICVVLLSLVLILSLCLRFFSGMLSPGSGIIGTVISPFQQFFTDVSGSVENFFKAVGEGNKLISENKELEEQVNELRGLSAENDELKLQNEFYKDYLEIKDKNPDFEFCDAKIVSRDTDDPFCSFTVNKGSTSGIKRYDPVIVGNYLIGYVEQVGITTSKVATVLNPQITLGVNDSRTGDPGILTGTADFAPSGKTKLYNLSRNCTVAVGDYIVTSGEGVFPSGLLVGTVDNIKTDEYTFSVYASVKIFADIEETKNVMIITDFEGQQILGESVD